MSSDGIQITIPDFNDEEFSSTPIPFGRSAGNAFGAGAFGQSGGNSSFGHGGSGFGSGGGGGSGSGADSPTATTPLAFPSERADRSYFHSRQDSITSDDSNHSTNYSAGHSSRFAPSKPFAHSSQTSVATTSTAPFTKKSSFASIRNAFKSGKSHDPPPVPQIDHQAYPVLKNPFNRSASSLAYTTPATTYRKASVTTSPPHQRPTTPGSSDPRPRGTLKSRNHSYAKSQHSQSGSIFHASDNGSDIGHGTPFSGSPPPVPRVPNAFGGQGYGNEAASPDYDDKVVMDPKSPSDYALHAVFIRFATAAERKIDAFLREGLERDPLLPDFMGPGVDPKFDELLLSLGKIAQKHTKPVVDSVMRWRRSAETVPEDIIRAHVSQSPVSNRGPVTRPLDARSILTERKSLASIYIMCRSLIEVLKSIGKDALGEAAGHSLEDKTFEQFKKPDLKLLLQSANHRSNAELYATLLGHIANVRFVSVTDRFLLELGPVAQGQVPKDSDFKYENLVKGIRHVPIKVWPPEAFEEGAEFMEAFSKSFENAHGLRLKSAFAETLVALLHPIGKTAQAEVNHPQWAKAIEIIYPRAKDMMAKPRYWHVAYPLAITSLCVAPHQFFLRNWTALFEAGLSKLKEKPFRVPVMNGMMRLIWTYLYRCQEPSSATNTKLDTLLKHFFPSKGLSVFPPDETLEPFILIMHYILSRHFEYGRDFCLELIQEPQIRNAQSTNVPQLLAPERMTTSIRAILLSLHAIEREEPTPTWPSSSDFSVVPSWDDYPSSSDLLPAVFMSKPGMKEFFERCGSALAVIALTCANSVGKMSVFDDQWSMGRLNVSYEDTSSLVIRRHLEGTVAYPSSLVPQINMLQTCFQSWPRCLHPSLPLNDAIDMLIQGVIHVEPQIGEVARATLKRFMVDQEEASAVLLRYTAFLFDPANVNREGSGTRLALESPRLLNLWVLLLDNWIHSITQKPLDSLTDDIELLIAPRIDDIEAGALFLLSHDSWPIHSIGVKVIRFLGVLLDYIRPGNPSTDPSSGTLRVVDLLHGKELEKSYLSGYDELLDKSELERLVQWRKSTRIDVPLRIADSDNEKDRKLWRYIFPAFMQLCIDLPNRVLSTCKGTLVAAASRYHPFVSHLAGLSSRVPPGLSTRTQTQQSKDGNALVAENRHLVDQWHFWVKILCCTAYLSESRPALTSAGRDHSRVPSDANFERERMTTTRGLFRYLTPFLDSEYTPFRDAAVMAISCFPTAAYPQLLEDLNLLASRQFYDDPRVKAAGLAGGPPVLGRTRRQERLYSAVARTYYLTAPLLQYQRSAARQAALTHVLKFVRTTQTFLTSPESRDNPSLQRLRRYFCGTVERLFDGLASLNDSDRFIPRNMHLALYRMCEEWCQLGYQSETVKHRLILMQRASAAGSSDPGAEPDFTVEYFRHETVLLSSAAVGALSSLCHKAYYSPESSGGSPVERSFLEYLKPLDASSTLDRLSAILGSSQVQAQIRGKKALRSLLTLHTQDAGLMDEALRRAYVNAREQDSSGSRFFEVVADIVCNAETHGFTFNQVVCLGLSNMCHSSQETRLYAFNMLETMHEQSAGLLSMSHFEGAVGSSSPSTYIHAHRQVSDCLAGEHPQQASGILSQFTNWLARLHDSSRDKLPMLLLQSLEDWIPHVNLMNEDKSGFSPDGLSALYHLVSLTMRYSRSHSEQILALWTRLVDPPHQSNGHATVRFLLEQSHKVGSAIFIECAANIVACLSQTTIGMQIFQDLCSVIEPARMLPNLEHKLAVPSADDVELWSDLDALFAEQPRLSLGAAQFALLFLSNVAFEHPAELQAQIPVLLHVIFAHIDHKVLFVRQQARKMLFQLLRSWTSRYDELPDRSRYPTRAGIKSALAHMEGDEDSIFWNDEESNAQIEPKMRYLCGEVLSLLEPLAPRLAESWGSWALIWGTSCSIRAIAFRSLQIFRALMPPVSMADVSQLLARLSNTIAAPDTFLQSFTSEIIQTLVSLAESPQLDSSLLALLFWCACACLSTTVEREFGQIVELLNAVLARIDLDDYHTVEHLLSQRPAEWIGTTSLQSSLLTGLRSANTAKATLNSLQVLAKNDDSRLIDPSDGRVRDLYTLSLPWCLHAMATDTQDEQLQEFATNIARLADMEERSSISRIMTSFVKSRFRTKDDFLRQSVSSLREHYGSDHWTEVVTLLLGLVLNKERWLRVQSLQILKVLFQQRETRSTVEVLGSELLMPLLRLLETDLAPQALDVLEEPMTISGGPAAKHVLRMSMHVKTLETVETHTEVFGMPEDSGWCVARSDTLRQICRSNTMAVFDTCKMPSRPSRIEFEPEHESETFSASLSASLDEDLGGLVQNLHELTSFFSTSATTHHAIDPTPAPSQQLEARVAAILAKSTDMAEVPQTPFEDVFRVNGMSTSDDEEDDDSSDGESEMDAFIFDSPSVYRSAPNGFRLH